jgi:hypothetical protein
MCGILASPTSWSVGAQGSVPHTWIGFLGYYVGIVLAQAGSLIRKAVPSVLLGT